MNPLLNYLVWLRSRIESGHSVSDSLKLYLEETQDEFSGDLRGLLLNQQTSYRKQSLRSPYRLEAFELTRLGVSGVSILERLVVLEEEVLDACHDQIEQYLQVLPTKAILPLLFFHFPAFVILLIGPILGEVFEALSN